MSEIIERPTGLPGDLKEMACPQAALRPLPIDSIMEMVLEAMDIPAMDVEYTIGDFWNPLSSKLHSWTAKKLTFGDWNYRLTGAMFWEFDLLIVELYAEKENFNVPIILDGFGLTGSINREEYDSRAYGVLEEIEGMLNRADKTIVQWNRICTEYEPIIYKKPPIEETIQYLLNEFYEIAEYDYRHFSEGFNSFDEFAESLEMSYDTISRVLSQECLVEFEPFGIEFIDEFMDSQKCMIRAVLWIKDVKMNPIVFEDVYDLYYDSLMFEDIEHFLREMFREILDNLIHWNEIMTGRGKDSGVDQRKNRGERLVSNTG